MEAARSLVLTGAGEGFFVRTLVADDLARGALVEVPVRGMPPLHRDVALVRRRGAALSPAAAELVEALRVQVVRLGFKTPTRARRGS
jgi:DNA-binding transcriptional LysR family regulator